MNTASLDQRLKQISSFQQRGELFAAIDAAESFLKQSENPPLKLRHLTVLLMARAGALNEAIRRYRDLDLHTETDTESRTLGARLLKDVALTCAPSEQPQALSKACKVYRDIYEDTGDSYPGINAATLALLINDQETAERIAQDILDEGSSAPGRQTDYWHLATMAEAQIIMGSFGDAANTIREAAKVEKISLSDRASTINQLRRLLEVLGQSEALLDPLKPKPAMHFTGHMIAAPGKDGRILADHAETLRNRIEKAVNHIDPGSAYGALACGSDILIAEYLIEKGIDLHVILPFAVEDFISASVFPAGSDWVERFQKCMKECASLTFLTNQPYLGDDILFGLGAKLAMGRTLLHARHIAGDAIQLAVWDGEAAIGPAGTAADCQTWKTRGNPLEIVDVSDLGRRSKGADSSIATTMPPSHNRVSAAMLFGDFKGFSKLGDAELPAYVEHGLGTVAHVLDTGTPGASFVNTWGDGLFVVWNSPAAAAERALALQEALVDLRAEFTGLQDDLSIRISLHYGVAYSMHDPVLKRSNYFGEAVARAARIEPVTPVGAIYATEPFAAMLVLDKESSATAEYVGIVEVAKDYGAFPLYRIHRKNG